MSKIKCLCNIRESVQLAPSVYSLWLEAPDIVEHVIPGQFVSLYCKDGDTLLPRPISVCEIDREKKCLRLVYRVVGAGTKEFSGLKTGDQVEVMGPLGNGFDSSVAKRPLLIGGGIGIPPMLELAKQFDGNATVVLGYRDSQMFLKDEFEKIAHVVIATDDGSVGTKGTVIDAIREKNLTERGVDVIYSCGPTPMLRGVKSFGLEHNLPTYVSMEEKMACGIGACLACVCQSKDVDGHSQVKNKRVCKDGPVFLSTEVEL